MLDWEIQDIEFFDEGHSNAGGGGRWGGFMSKIKSGLSRRRNRRRAEQEARPPRPSGRRRPPRPSVRRRPPRPSGRRRPPRPSVRRRPPRPSVRRKPQSRAVINAKRYFGSKRR